MKAFLKLNFEKLFKEDLYYTTSLIFLLALTYWQLIIHDPILNYDDSVLLYSLGKINNLSHYFNSIMKGFILDVQPIRDLSFYFDFKLKSFFPFYSFHLTNLIIWILICLNVRGIFKVQFPKHYYAVGLIVLIYALSPISANSVAWISARKHLLSTLFITYSTLWVIKNSDTFSPSKALLIILFYFLSCFSQPINSLWFLWLCYWLFSQNKIDKSKLLLTGCALVCVISVLTNLYYYRIIYTKYVSSSSKFINIATMDFGDPILALGRYFYQCLNVFSALPSSHYQGSWENLLGISLMVIFLFYCYKQIQRGQKHLVGPIIYFFFPLVIVTVNMTNIFCSDTYLLNSSIGFYWCVLIISEKFKSQKILLYCLSIYLLTAAIYNLNYVKIFLNEDELWLYSQKKEANSQTTIVASSIYIKQKKFKESYLLIKELQERWPNQLFLPQVIAENLFYNPSIPSNIKIQEMLKITPKMPSTYLYLSILYAYDGNRLKTEEFLFKIFDNPSRFNMEFRGNEEKISAAYLYTCAYFKFKNCEKKLREFQGRALRKDWEESLIKEYLRVLNKSEYYQINL